MAEAREAEIAGFLAARGWGAAVRAPLAGDASARRYFRLRRGSDRAVLMDADPAKGEGVERFVTVGRWLLDRGYSAPEILAKDAGRGFLLLEDLGDGLFARLMADDPSRTGDLYRLAVRFLEDLHRHPAPGFAVLHDGRALGALVTLLDEFYLPALGAPPAAAARLAPVIASLHDRLNDLPPVLSLRDFHAENLLWFPGRDGVRQAGVLDFQDAMAAHPAYDLVSLLQDARRDVPTEVEQTCVASYVAAKGLEQSRFSAVYALLGAQRALRILAVFARLCIRDGKPRYLDFMPRVWGYLGRNLAHPALAELAAVVGDVVLEPTPENIERIAGHARA